MSKSRVSIVIVNWKTPELLAGCLDSIYADSRWQDFEIWVVDNASDDGSVEMLREDYKDVFLVANEENVGFAKACNQVIPLATGKYVLLLNPDTIIDGQAITTLADYMDNHLECGAVGPKVLNSDGTLQLACRRSFPDPATAFFRLTYLSRLFPKNRRFASYNLTWADPDTELYVDALSGSAMMLRKSVIDRIGLLDEDIFMFGEDIDWCWRVKQEGLRVAYCPKAVIYHYHGASSRLRPVGATINLHKGMEVFYRKHLAQTHSPFFNSLVYAGIWLRAALFIALSAVRMLLPQKRSSSKDTGVFAFVAERAPQQLPTTRERQQPAAQPSMYMGPDAGAVLDMSPPTTEIPVASGIAATSAVE